LFIVRDLHILMDVLFRSSIVEFALV
jgi:hypothetical protein